MTFKTILIVLVGLFAVLSCEARITTTTREPSLQAYGLPKRILASNGYIERINLGSTGEAKITKYPGDPTGAQRRHKVNHGSGVDAALEILHLDSSLDRKRERRSAGKEDSATAGNDLQTAESKVFRPLFVYRQQVARRQRIQREKELARNTKPRQSNNRNSLHYYPHSG